MESIPKWTRPTEAVYPTIWRRFQGSKQFPNGKYPKFRVQDMTPDTLEDVLSHMFKCYMEDEPLSKSLKVKMDPKAVEDQLEIWRIFARYKMVLVCLLENKDELDDDSLPIIAGCNMTGVTLRNVPVVEYQPKSSLTQKVFDLLTYLHKKVDIFQYYELDQCVYALGLSVDPIFRGQGVGHEIMKARFQLGKACGLKATVTVFTNIASQKVAEAAGFETLYEIDYDNYKVNDEVVFKGISTKSVKVMGAKIN